MYECNAVYVLFICVFLYEEVISDKVILPSLLYSLTLNVFIDMFSITLKINKEAIHSRIIVTATQLFNYQDIPLYASDDKVYFPPATKICREEMSSTATQ